MNSTYRGLVQLMATCSFNNGTVSFENYERYYKSLNNKKK